MCKGGGLAEQGEGTFEGLMRLFSHAQLALLLAPFADDRRCETVETEMCGVAGRNLIWCNYCTLK